MSNPATKEMSFILACKDFFGLLPGQTASSFLNEIKALSVAERAEVKRGLEQNGYMIKAS